MVWISFAPPKAELISQHPSDALRRYFSTSWAKAFYEKSQHSTQRNPVFFWFTQVGIVGRRRLLFVQTSFTEIRRFAAEMKCVFFAKAVNWSFVCACISGKSRSRRWFAQLHSYHPLVFSAVIVQTSTRNFDIGGSYWNYLKRNEGGEPLAPEWEETRGGVARFDHGHSSHSSRTRMHFTRSPPGAFWKVLKVFFGWNSFALEMAQKESIFYL